MFRAFYNYILILRLVFEVDSHLENVWTELSSAMHYASVAFASGRVLKC